LARSSHDVANARDSQRIDGPGPAPIASLWRAEPIVKRFFVRPLNDVSLIWKSCASIALASLGIAKLLALAKPSESHGGRQTRSYRTV
jgi:hypothetical protein